MDENRKSQIDRTRKLLDFLEANETLPTPYWVGTTAEYISGEYTKTSTKARMMAVAKTLKALGGFEQVRNRDLVELHYVHDGMKIIFYCKTEELFPKPDAIPDEAIPNFNVLAEETPPAPVTDPAGIADAEPAHATELETVGGA